MGQEETASPHAMGQGGVSRIREDRIRMSSQTWLDIQQLAEQLGCSDRLVYEMRSEGLLVPGVDFYTLGKGTIRGKHIYCLELCREALLLRTAKKTKLKAKAQRIKPTETYNEDH